MPDTDVATLRRQLAKAQARFRRYPTTQNANYVGTISKRIYEAEREER